MQGTETMSPPTADTQKPDKANRLSRAWLILISLISAGLCGFALLDVIHAPLWLTAVFGLLAIGAFLLATVAPPHIRKAFAEFLAWPW
ncbi:hypothetical protein FKV24_004470 [Lysobacter maris]|uniref:Uncharacterized protein n=1 Tax=Marilutibacter maris TaxID=1605891 RepID=A0A508B0A2_9GAMM|nr:hypothetical protein [Lysobacter maris]KAB8196205.1 hypothetical protein FKV24_004470 [Lysobacter maris]